jgi:pimeloyl-ACP methyl ester carboxylesterase
MVSDPGLVTDQLLAVTAPPSDVQATASASTRRGSCKGKSRRRPMNLEAFNANHKTVTTPAGEIAYVDFGTGPTVLFVLGVVMSSYLWRNVIAEVCDERRCVALDLPVHGRTQISSGQDITAAAQAEVIDGFCEALGLDNVDLVANDSGGAISQIFTVRHPERVRTLTLTNCDCHDQLAPAAFKQTVDAAKAGSGSGPRARGLASVRRRLCAPARPTTFKA